MRALFSLKEIFKRREIRSEYFSSLADEIIKINIYNMLWTSVAGIIILTSLIWLTPYIIKNWTVTREYFALYPVFCVFFILSSAMIKFKISNYKLAQGICALMYLLLFAVFALISIFPYPDNSQVYISLYIMILPVMFVTRTGINTALTLVMAIGFIAAAYIYKPYHVADDDIFSVVAAVMFSRVLAYMLIYIRTKNFIARNALLKEAHTDMLTSLLNRNGCEYYCREYMMKMDKVNYTVMMLDLDNFKAVNDTYGHDKGDYVLKTFAAALKKRFKDRDVISRIGGDEFFLLIKNVSDKNEVVEKARSIIGIANDIGRQVGIPLGSSIGAVIFRGRKLNFEQLYKISDGFLYTAKSKGKNTYSISEYV